MATQGFASLEGINEAGVFNADGCTTYSIYNAGNVNITIDGLLVIKPLGTWDGPPMIPGNTYHGKHKIEFDLVTPPTFYAPIPGANPPIPPAPGGPAIPRDPRALVMRINVK